MPPLHTHTLPAVVQVAPSFLRELGQFLPRRGRVVSFPLKEVQLLLHSLWPRICRQNALEETQTAEKRRKTSFHCPHMEKPLPGSRSWGSSQAGCLLIWGQLGAAHRPPSAPVSWMNTDLSTGWGLRVCVKHLGSGNLFKDKKRELGGNLDMTEWARWSLLWRKRAHLQDKKQRWTC